MTDNEVQYSELPSAPDLFNHPVPTGTVGTELFNDTPPFDSLPDPIAPVYGDSDVGVQISRPYNDDPLFRNYPENMFAIVYDPESINGPHVKYVAGVIIEGNNVIQIGGTPGSLQNVMSNEHAPLDDDITWYLNVQSDRSASTVSSTKDPLADFWVPLAKITKGCNGYIQQLHRGAVFLSTSAYGFEVQLEFNEQGTRTGIKVRPGIVMLNGKSLGKFPETLQDEPWYYSAFTQDGPVYLRLTLDDYSMVTGSAIEFELATPKIYNLVIGAEQKEDPPFTYSFLLADIKEKQVIQYLLGTVQLPVGGGTFFPYGAIDE